MPPAGADDAQVEEEAYGGVLDKQPGAAEPADVAAASTMSAPAAATAPPQKLRLNCASCSIMCEVRIPAMDPDRKKSIRFQIKCPRCHSLNETRMAAPHAPKRRQPAPAAPLPARETLPETLPPALVAPARAAPDFPPSKVRITAAKPGGDQGTMSAREAKQRFAREQKRLAQQGAGGPAGSADHPPPTSEPLRDEELLAARALACTSLYVGSPGPSHTLMPPSTKKPSPLMKKPSPSMKQSQSHSGGSSSGRSSGCPSGPMLTTRPNDKRSRSPDERGDSEEDAPRNDFDLSALLLDQLADYIVACGGSTELLDGWSTKSVVRRNSCISGHRSRDTYYISPRLKQFRSRTDVARHFGLLERPDAREEEWVACDHCGKWRVLPPSQQHTVPSDPNAPWRCSLIGKRCDHRKGRTNEGGRGRWAPQKKQKVVEEDVAADEQWVSCDVCCKWRMLKPSQHYTVPSDADAPWDCSLIRMRCEDKEEVQFKDTWRLDASVVAAHAARANEQAQTEGLPLERGGGGGGSSGGGGGAGMTFLHVVEMESKHGTPYRARVALGGGLMQDLGAFVAPEEAALVAARFVRLLAPTDAALVGRRVDVYWPLDAAWYTAVVESVCPEGLHSLRYVSDDICEEVDLGREAWCIHQPAAADGEGDEEHDHDDDVEDLGYDDDDGVSRFHANKSTSWNTFLSHYRATVGGSLADCSQAYSKLRVECGTEWAALCAGRGRWAPGADAAKLATAEAVMAQAAREGIQLRVDKHTAWKRFTGVSINKKSGKFDAAVASGIGVLARAPGPRLKHELAIGLKLAEQAALVVARFQNARRQMADEAKRRATLSEEDRATEDEADRLALQAEVQARARAEAAAMAREEARRVREAARARAREERAAAQNSARAAAIKRKTAKVTAGHPKHPPKRPQLCDPAKIAAIREAMGEREHADLAVLAAAVEKHGGDAEWVSDWVVGVVARQNSAVKADDSYFYGGRDGEVRRFRSRPEVFRYFELVEGQCASDRTTAAATTTAVARRSMDGSGKHVVQLAERVLAEAAKQAESDGAQSVGATPAAVQSLGLEKQYGERVTEAEGLRLHLAEERQHYGQPSTTGYHCVREKSNGRFQAVHNRGGKSTHLGTFKTAVEAAVAYAKYVHDGDGEVDIAMEEDDDDAVELEAAVIAAALPRALPPPAAAAAADQSRARPVPMTRAERGDLPLLTLQEAAPKVAEAPAEDFAVNQKVVCRFLAKDVGTSRSKWYEGKIKAKHANGTYDIRYNDGDFEAHVPSRYIRPTGAAPAYAKQAGAPPPPAPVGPTAAAARMDAVREMLVGFRLDQYADAFDEQVRAPHPTPCCRLPPLAAASHPLPLSPHPLPPSPAVSCSC